MRTIFLALLLVVSSAAFANNIMFGPPHAVTATSASAKVLNQNTLRSYLIIVNTGATNNAYVKFGSTQTGAEGIPIAPGASYEPKQAPSNSVYVDTASSTTTVVLIEGQ